MSESYSPLGETEASYWKMSSNRKQKEKTLHSSIIRQVHAPGIPVKERISSLKASRSANYPGSAVLEYLDVYLVVKGRRHRRRRRWLLR